MIPRGASSLFLQAKMDGEGGSQCSLMLPIKTETAKWWQLYNSRANETTARSSRDCLPQSIVHPQLGVAFVLDRSHFHEDESLIASTQRHMPILNISSTADRPATLQHLQVYFHRIQLSQTPTPREPLWLCLVLHSPHRPAIRLRENIVRKQCRLECMSYPCLEGYLPNSWIPQPLTNLELEPGSLLELQTDSTVVDLKVEVTLFLQDVVS